MCRCDVAVEAQTLLAELLREMATALHPDDPGAVVVGPVDFGPAACTSNGETPA